MKILPSVLQTFSMEGIYLLDNPKIGAYLKNNNLSIERFTDKYQIKNRTKFIELFNKQHSSKKKVTLKNENKNQSLFHYYHLDDHPKNMKHILQILKNIILKKINGKCLSSYDKYFLAQFSSKAIYIRIINKLFLNKSLKQLININMLAKNPAARDLIIKTNVKDSSNPSTIDIMLNNVHHINNYQLSRNIGLDNSIWDYNILNDYSDNIYFSVLSTNPTYLELMLCNRLDKIHHGFVFENPGIFFISRT